MKIYFKLPCQQLWAVLNLNRSSDHHLISGSLDSQKQVLSNFEILVTNFSEVPLPLQTRILFLRENWVSIPWTLNNICLESRWIIRPSATLSCHSRLGDVIFLNRTEIHLFLSSSFSLFSLLKLIFHEIKKFQFFVF